MNKLITWAALSIASLIFTATHAKAEQAEVQGGQFQTLGDWQVHYLAFPSTFVQPNIAKNYGLKRSNRTALVNISVLANSAGNPAQHVTISGVARNLLGNAQTLSFKEVTEGEAIYYLAQFDYYNEELYRFELVIRQNNQEQRLNFQQKFYVD
ncbi:DUF4426 domain-containing protein [Pseudoalteromonas fenneropenaei]|uniref:DUF4426 domain-containing protein n=1 Tax=Pseudoalteromonas fenneropenaei TaxID=1737459 RepID=A0ABV7CHB8_9GAMM